MHVPRLCLVFCLLPLAIAAESTVPDIEDLVEVAPLTPGMPAAEDQAKLKVEALRIIRELQRLFPLSASYTYTVQPQSNEEIVTEVVFAHVGEELYFRYERRGDGIRNASYNGQSARIVRQGPRQKAKAVVVADLTNFQVINGPSPYGLRFLLPYYQWPISLSGLLSVHYEGTGQHWEVLKLGDESILLRMWTGTDTRILEVDRLRGGNLIRDESWLDWGTPQARRKRYLESYALQQFQDVWLPKVLVYANEDGTSRGVHTFEWQALKIDTSPANFLIEFPEGIAVEDETTFIAGVTRVRERTGKQVQELGNAFWDFWD